MSQKIRPEFSANRVNETGYKKAFEMAEKLSDLMNWLEQPEICAKCAELTIANRRLEEAWFYAKRALIKNPVNQEK